MRKAKLLKRAIAFVMSIALTFGANEVGNLVGRNSGRTTQKTEAQSSEVTALESGELSSEQVQAEEVLNLMYSEETSETLSQEVPNLEEQETPVTTVPEEATTEILEEATEGNTSSEETTEITTETSEENMEATEETTETTEETTEEEEEIISEELELRAMFDGMTLLSDPQSVYIETIETTNAFSSHRVLGARTALAAGSTGTLNLNCQLVENLRRLLLRREEN